jgi:hypothetical protein
VRSIRSNSELTGAPKWQETKNPKSLNSKYEQIRSKEKTNSVKIDLDQRIHWYKGCVHMGTLEALNYRYLLLNIMSC